MKSSGGRGERPVPLPGANAKSGPPARRGKSGEGAASALEQVQLLERARQQQQRACQDPAGS